MSPNSRYNYIVTIAYAAYEKILTQQSRIFFVRSLTPYNYLYDRGVTRVLVCGEQNATALSFLWSRIWTIVIPE